MCHKTRAAGMSIFIAKGANTAPQVLVELASAPISVRGSKQAPLPIVEFARLRVPASIFQLNPVNQLQLRIVLICVKKQFLGIFL
jgi:hypothetical protein